MGGRDLPVECEHGVVIDGGDFADSQECDQCLGGADDLTAEEVQRLADMVSWGMAVTFPNGVTIDKRPLVNPPPYNPAGTLGNLTGGWTCSNCKSWVANGTSHYCTPNIGGR